MPQNGKPGWKAIYQQPSIPADLEAGLAQNEQAKDEADGPLIGSACPK